MSIVHTPFSDDQVKALNMYQEHGMTHPYTCGNNSMHENLIATRNGWICPMCDYVQKWAHAYTADLESMEIMTGIPLL